MYRSILCPKYPPVRGGDLGKGLGPGGDFGQKILAGGRGRGNFYAKKLPNINSYDIDQEADLKHFKVQKYTFFGSRNSIWGPKRGSKCQIGQISHIQAKLG